LLLQIAFDIYDANCDGKITQLDIFKIVFQFGSGPMADTFNQKLYNDVCQMSSKISNFLKFRRLENLAINQEDSLYLERFQNFRNLTLLDPRHLHQKERVVWPLYEYQP